jgi:hypothetical protein
MRSSKSERWTDNTMTSISLIYCSSFVIVLSVHLSYLLLLIYHCIVWPYLWFIAPRWSLYCLSISLIYCSSFTIILSVHLSDLLLLICYCIVCPSLQFTAPHLPLYFLSISPIYCSSFVIVGEMERKHNEKWGAVNRRDGQTIQWQMRSSKSERWIDNTMANEK